ncbi:MAG: T9SS C-terminal target domain-containing protein, partial [Vicingaceae bacterium]
MKPGSINNITVGVVWARATAGDPFASVEILRRADDKAQALFENCFKVLDAPHAPILEIQELENELILTISNTPASNNYGENYIEFDPFIVTEDSTADRNYRFQGYMIYQLKDDAVSLSDITDVSKSRLVAQCDIEDGVARLINFDFDQNLGAGIAEEMVDGENKGIRHSFSIKEDEFAQGDKVLVNFKRYHYIAVAYAYNNYKDYDPTDPGALDGQQKPFLPSRKAAIGEVKVIEAIPHNPTPEAGGTSQNIEYGSSPVIRRLDGYGNGNRALELTQASKDYILQNGYLETPEYTRGHGPINIKVVDPLNVADGYFECEFIDYSASPSNGADTASWVVHRYDQENGVLLESIFSERTVKANNEQIIPEWGVSVQIQQKNYHVPAGGSGFLSTTMISSEMTYSDSSRQWMRFIQDNDGFFPTNWIRSGTYTTEAFGNIPSDCLDPTSSFYKDYLDPCNYK